MALAVLQVGLYATDQLVVQGAARSGAREAAVTIDDSAVIQAVDRAASALDPNLLDAAVEREGGSGDPVTVTVTYHAGVDVPVVSWLFPSTVDLQAAVTMRQETG